MEPIGAAASSAVAVFAADSGSDYGGEASDRFAAKAFLLLCRLDQRKIIMTMTNNRGGDISTEP